MLIPDTNRQPVLSFVIPVRCGAETLQPLCAGIETAAAQTGNLAEIVLVDDASRDGSWSVIQALAVAIPHVLGIRLAKNYGQHNATAVGLAHATGAIVVTMDEDLQHPPDEIHLLLDRLSETGADLVYGLPYRRRQRWWRRGAGALLMPILTRLVGIHTSVSAFRAIQQPLSHAVNNIRRADLILDVHLAHAARRIETVRFHHGASARRHSSYSTTKLGLLVARVLLGYIMPTTWVPLLATALAAGGMAAIAMGPSGQLVESTIQRAGFAAVAVAIALFFAYVTGLWYRHIMRSHPDTKIAATCRSTTHNLE